MRLHDLSPAARQAAEMQAIRGEWEHAAFDQLLKELVTYATGMNNQLALLTRWMIAAIVVAVWCVIAGLKVIDNGEGAMGAAILVGGIAHLIVSVVFWRRPPKKALPKDALAMVQQLFRQVRQDLDAKVTVRVNVDLSGPTEAKRGERQELPARGFASRHQFVYADPWCQLRLQLRDGYTLTLRQLDQHVEVRRLKRKGTGYKTKTKYKKICRLTATIVPPGPVEWVGQPWVDPTWERLRVAKKKGLDVAVLDRWFVYKEKDAKPKQNPSGDEAVGMLYRLCSMRPVEAR
jgi:hypothetical protein